MLCNYIYIFLCIIKEKMLFLSYLNYFTSAGEKKNKNFSFLKE